MAHFNYSLMIPEKDRQKIRDSLYGNPRLGPRVTVSRSANGLDVSIVSEDGEGPDFYRGVILGVLGVNGAGSTFKLTSYSADPRLEALGKENKTLSEEVVDLRRDLTIERKSTNILLERLDQLDEPSLVAMKNDPTHGILRYLSAQAPKTVPVYSGIETMLADPLVGSDLKEIRELSEATLVAAVRKLELPQDVLNFLKCDSDVDGLVSARPDMEPEDFKELRAMAEKSQALLDFLEDYSKGRRSGNPLFDEAVRGMIDKEKEKATLGRFNKANQERTSAIARVRQMAERYVKIRANMGGIEDKLIVPVEYAAIVRPSDQGIVLQVSTPCESKDGFIRAALTRHIETAQEADGTKALNDTGQGDPENLLTRRFFFPGRDGPSSIALADTAVKKLLGNHRDYDPFTLGLKLLIHCYIQIS